MVMKSSYLVGSFSNCSLIWSTKLDASSRFIDMFSVREGRECRWVLQGASSVAGREETSQFDIVGSNVLSRLKNRAVLTVLSDRSSEYLWNSIEQRETGTVSSVLMLKLCHTTLGVLMFNLPIIKH